MRLQCTLLFGGTFLLTQIFKANNIVTQNDNINYNWDIVSDYLKKIKLVNTKIPIIRLVNI